MRFLYVILIILFFTSCQKITVYEAAKIRLAGSSKTFDLLREKDPINVCKLSSLTSKDFYIKRKDKWVLDYDAINGKKLEFNPAVVREIKRSVFYIDSYNYGVEVACDPKYSYMLEYENHKIIFCLGCSLVGVYNKSKRIGGGLLRDDVTNALRNEFQKLN